MNWDQLEGKWKQATGKVKEKWGRLTDSDIQVIRGQRDQLIGKIQERYGIAKEEAQKQADEFVRALNFGDSTEITSVTGDESRLLDEQTTSGRFERGRGAGRS